MNFSLVYNVEGVCVVADLKTKIKIKYEMEAKNLRIGNFLTLPYKVRLDLFENEIWATKPYFEVDAVSGDNLCLLKLDEESEKFDLTDVRPIPLTEEWLKRTSLDYCRFKEAFVNSFFCTWKEKEGWKCTYNGHFIKNIKYVHELQNLFFAITGQELELKDKS